MNEFETKVLTEDDFGGFMQKIEATTTFIPTLDQNSTNKEYTSVDAK